MWEMAQVLQKELRGEDLWEGRKMWAQGFQNIVKSHKLFTNQSMNKVGDNLKNMLYLQI